eukprot:TRINITY_DN769_c0_g3_i1.p1 TRINITY_DN769_c0_g3~~TRINITY_DN769_c0_g3_i1.p1  ORF type:complete len:340 (+),score=107.30 TRINITY_DN769_c0_g3_i1:42-1061(+)
MGKKGGVLLDNGKTAKHLSPLEAQKQALKKKRVQQNEEIRRKKKFIEAIKNDPESIRRKVASLEKQAKSGTLSFRQRNEKNEMKELLAEYEPKFKKEAALQAKGSMLVSMQSAFKHEMAVEGGAPDGVTMQGVLVNDEVLAPVAAPPSAPVAENPTTEYLPQVGGTPFPVESVVEGDIVSAASNVDMSLLQKKKAEEAEESEMKWNPNLMASLVPSSVLRRKTTTAVQSKIRAQQSASLSSTMAPVEPAKPAQPAPQPKPKQTNNFRTVNLVPDYDDEDDDDDDLSLDEPTYTPAAASSSMFFNSSGALSTATAASSKPEPQAPAADLDEEYKKFLAGM